MGDSASGRRADMQATSDNVKAAAVDLTTSGSGAVRVRTTPLLTVENGDKALEVKCGTVHRGSRVKCFTRRKKEDVCV